MTTNNPFVLPPEDYKRDLNVVKKYIETSAYYLSKKTGKPVDEMIKWIADGIKNRTIPFKDPKILTLVRQENGDRVQDNGEGTYLGYLENIERSELIVSPTMTTYTNPKVKASLIAKYVEHNMELRDIDKKESQVAEMDGNLDLAAFKDILQTLRKVMNNSISGSHGSPGTPLYNLSAHPTLTSTCRCATSYANANNERFLAGVRHYWSYDIAIGNIASIVSNSDYKAIAETMEMYDLTVPTVEDVMYIVEESTSNYWRMSDKLNKIRDFVNTLTDLERAAYCYSQDCYTLARLNEDLVKTMILEFATCPTVPVDNPNDYIKQLDSDRKALVSVIASDHIDGRRLEVVEKEDPVSYGIVGAAAKNVNEQLMRYSDIITTFWRTQHTPSSIYNFPSAVRKTVVVSDTDSTIFTVADWVKLCFGKIKFDVSGKSVAATMVYFTSQTLVHLLALFSTNMGVEKKRLHQLEMKNEYMMESLILTGKAKHYAYRTIVKEGNVYKDPKLDIKGVTLRNSKVPPVIMNGVHTMISDIMDDVKEKGTVEVTKYLTRVGNVERMIRDAIAKGSPEYLTRTQLLPKESYKKPLSSAYFYYLMWEEVFAPKYGHIGMLPATTVKLSMTTTNKTLLTQWINSFEDPAMVSRMNNFLTTYKRTSLKMLLVPTDVLKSGSIPKEIINGSSYRHTIYSVAEAYYLLLESLGYYSHNDKITRLVSDTY